MTGTGTRRKSAKSGTRGKSVAQNQSCQVLAIKTSSATTARRRIRSIRDTTIPTRFLASQVPSGSLISVHSESRGEQRRQYVFHSVRFRSGHVAETVLRVRPASEFLHKTEALALSRQRETVETTARCATRTVPVHSFGFRSGCRNIHALPPAAATASTRSRLHDSGTREIRSGDPIRSARVWPPQAIRLSAVRA